MTPPLPPESPLGDPAAISADDVERAKLAWAQAVPAEYRNLLEADPEDVQPV